MKKELDSITLYSHDQAAWQLCVDCRDTKDLLKAQTKKGAMQKVLENLGDLYMKAGRDVSDVVEAYVDVCNDCFSGETRTGEVAGRYTCGIGMRVWEENANN